MDVFRFIDGIEETKDEQSLRASFTLNGTEEFLKDHFGGFPVMPGVLLLESLKQAASCLLTRCKPGEGSCYRLAWAEEVKFGQFVKPGSRLLIDVRLSGQEGASHIFEGRIDLLPQPAGGQKLKVLTARLALSSLVRKGTDERGPA